MCARDIYKVIISVALTLSYFFLPKYGYVAVSGFPVDYTSHLLYPISHANIWHLLLNICCLWMLRCPIRLHVTYPIAVIASFLPCLSFSVQHGFALLTEPTMGFSAILFAMVGMSWGYIGQFRNMLWRNKWFLIILPFIPHVNFLIHIYTMLLGYLAAYCYTHCVSWFCRENKPPRP